MKLAIGLALLSAQAGALAQTAQQSAAHAPEGPSFVPMTLALILVLALIGAAMWALRRAGLAPRAGNTHLRLVSQLAVGPRERVILVEAGDRWWLLGIGAGGVSRLGSLPKGASLPAEGQAPHFGSLLEKLRGGAR